MVQNSEHEMSLNRENLKKFEQEYEKTDFENHFKLKMKPLNNGVQPS